MIIWKDDLKNDIKNKMLEGWSYHYSCASLGVDSDKMYKLLREDPVFKAWVEEMRKEIKAGRVRR